MEPPVAVAEYRDGKVLAWAPTQNPQAVQETIAGVLGIKKEDVTCHVTLLGGGFRPQVEAGPGCGSSRPFEAAWQTGKGGLEPRGRHSLRLFPLGGRHVHEGGGWRRWQAYCVVAADGLSTDRFDVRRFARAYADDEMGLGWNNLPFDIPNHRAENGPADFHVRIGWLRSVANIYHAFAIHSFADELAAMAQEGSGAISARPDRAGPNREPGIERRRGSRERQELSARHGAVAASG